MTASRPRTGRLLMAVWLACVVVFAIGLGRVVLAYVDTGQIPPEIFVGSLVALVGPGPLLFGVVAGRLIPAPVGRLSLRRRASYGVIALALPLLALWNADPRLCTAADDCDLAFGLAASLVAALAYAPFLVGDWLGRELRRRSSA